MLGRSPGHRTEQRMEMTSSSAQAQTFQGQWQVSLLAILHWARGAGMLLHPLTCPITLNLIQIMLRLLGKLSQKFGSLWFSLELHPLPEPWLGLYSPFGFASQQVKTGKLASQFKTHKKINENISGVEKSVSFAEIGLGQFGSWQFLPWQPCGPSTSPHTLILPFFFLKIGHTCKEGKFLQDIPDLEHIKLIFFVLYFG